MKGDSQLAESRKESNQITKRQALPDTYPAFLQELKQRIRESQLRASVSVNRELVLLYWRIGRDILVRQQREHWGAKVIDRLAADLKKAFPEMKGFSPRNLKYMRAFRRGLARRGICAAGCCTNSVVPQLRHCSKSCRPNDDRVWYAKATIQHGWSRNVLVHQIETRCTSAPGAAVTNFERTLPPPQSDLAQQITKDPYTFDFLMLGEDAHERELEQRLTGASERFPAGIGCWLCLRRQSVSTGSGRK